MPQDSTIQINKPDTAAFVVAALYKFTAFAPETLEETRAQLKADCIAAGIKGTLLIAPEGINGTIAGSREAIEAALDIVRRLPGCRDIEHKESWAYTPPFQKMKVRLKTEIVRMAVPAIDPNRIVGTYVEPEDWNTLISAPDVITIDTRNDYEVAIGTFKGAVDPETGAFRQFPEWVKTNLDPAENRKVAMFCTGGIRCEKATAYLKEQGFKEVYHLRGGILNYLETIPPDKSLWHGECFVFDDRVSVKHNLDVGNYEWCPVCDGPVRRGEICCPVDGTANTRPPDYQKHTANNRPPKYSGKAQPSLASRAISATVPLLSSAQYECDKRAGMKDETRAITSSVWTIRLALFSTAIVLLTILFHRIFGMGTLVALNLFTLAFIGAGFVLLLGTFALVRIWQRGWRGGANALIGIAIACAILAWPLSLIPIAYKYPMINDVSTDLREPPRFILLAGRRPRGANSMVYPGKAFAIEQRKAYKDIGPLRFNRPAIEMLELVRQTLRRMHMVVAGVIPVDSQETGRGQIEAVDRTLIFGFYDDVVVRVTRIQSGSLVDIRSSSRFGKSDLGRNAIRIREFQEELVARVQATVPAASKNGS